MKRLRRKKKLTPALADVRNGLLDRPAAIQPVVLFAVVLFQLDRLVAGPAQGAAGVLERGHHDGVDGAVAEDVRHAAGCYFGFGGCRC